MNTIDLIRHNLATSRTITLARIEDMRGHALVPPTPNGGAHTLWTLGHLAFIEGAVIHGFMLGDPNPLADHEEPFDGADVSPDPDMYPPFDATLALCRDMRERTLALLATMSEDDLDTPSAAAPDGHEAMFGTRRLCFQFAADHWLMHRGQLADARRAAGMERSWF